MKTLARELRRVVRKRVGIPENSEDFWVGWTRCETDQKQGSR